MVNAIRLLRSGLGDPALPQGPQSSASFGIQHGWHRPEPSQAGRAFFSLTHGKPKDADRDGMQMVWNVEAPSAPTAHYRKAGINFTRPDFVRTIGHATLIDDAGGVSLPASSLRASLPVADTRCEHFPRRRFAGRWTTWILLRAILPRITSAQLVDASLAARCGMTRIDSRSHEIRRSPHSQRCIAAPVAGTSGPPCGSIRMHASRAFDSLAAIHRLCVTPASDYDRNALPDRDTGRHSPFST